MAKDNTVLVTRGSDGKLRQLTSKEEESFVPNDQFFRKLSEEYDEEYLFKKWAMDNFEIDRPASPLWHPVVRQKWAELQATAEELRKEGYPDGKPATGITG